MRDPMHSPPFPAATAAFELPCVTHALELLRELHTEWVGWIENRLDGTFVVVLAPETIGELAAVNPNLHAYRIALTDLDRLLQLAGLG